MNQTDINKGVQYVCANCGCSEITIEATIDFNTHTVICEDNINTVYCTRCEHIGEPIACKR